jgi:hypothetical protein
VSQTQDDAGGGNVGGDCLSRPFVLPKKASDAAHGWLDNFLTLESEIMPPQVDRISRVLVTIKVTSF